MSKTYNRFQIRKFFDNNLFAWHVIMQLDNSQDDPLWDLEKHFTDLDFNDCLDLYDRYERDLYNLLGMMIDNQEDLRQLINYEVLSAFEVYGDEDRNSALIINAIDFLKVVTVRRAAYFVLSVTRENF